MKPAACRARRADSRPEPGPQTSTSSDFMPCSWAFLAQSSAAIWAANGVDLREPLKPLAPADDQAIALPCASVMVIRSEEHTSELQPLMRISYAVFRLKKKQN